MSVLDDVEKIRAVDPQNMYNRIFDLPEQLDEALKIGQSWKIDADSFADIKNIVVIGMGGSAIGGDLVRTYLTSKLLVPFQVCRHYVLPEYVDDETLVIASSYSGNTEETLTALDDALGRKAMVAGLTTGGMLEEVSRLNDFPVAILPKGLQPRAALGYSFVPLLMFLEKIGLIKNVGDEIKEVIAHLSKLREQYIEGAPVKKNPAKQLAEKIHGKIAVIYSGPSLTDAVALRWKGQICENGKNLAFANHYPEFNHNELVGWSETVAAHRERLIVIQLRDIEDLPQIVKRMDIVRSLIDAQGIEVVNVSSNGPTPLARMFSLIQKGDFVSYYLAVLNEVDPTPVEVIESLKKMLSGR
ncbi:MAG: bifunctional phosphoglucose/phosphomannose isomerase [Candidatus Zixiibacteriota bacterium]|nr:MAG: bifunctional phosphoglucose/phosphomannose isomerase [candidate division Zixibacteria bacterium]